MTFDPWKFFMAGPTAIAPEAIEEYEDAVAAEREAQDALWKAERALHADRYCGADNPTVAAEYAAALTAWKAAVVRLRAL